MRLLKAFQVWETNSIEILKRELQDFEEAMSGQGYLAL